ncbi:MULTISPECIES: flagellin lysine-N-methylase [unclassified Pantoea]|uniref:flagellin lysine-N-methylase n=1 Tax=unclassified Pantoea TaxID=2630326 RepID=UPI001CD7CB69|nr:MULTISPECIES: flagellin lysine-N-methylase [unclassified Pantoea]MCA1176397.1 flagellin lysine-N-methylase [Pantoea sp. alder69]MCA1249367.1 flagellin lysine-N-methylase [Pantoea sp. alder70]MCA1264558.1 flagellin lysine-N-methylase [Pantoea sp. alder81]
MKEISVVSPVFFDTFKCIGGECREHCCKGWVVTLDKPTVNRYLKSGEIDIRSIATENIITTKSSYDNWGKMKMSEQGQCAFMDEERLCKIHKSLGASALSATCATYPRVQKKYKIELRQSLTLSCPEAAKQLLMRADSMLLEYKKILQPQTFKVADVDQESRLINLMCTNILLCSGVNLEEGFYGIALLFLYLDKIVDVEQKHEKLEEYYFSIVESINNGQIKSKIYDVKPDYQLQWGLLLRIQTHLSQRPGVRGWSTLQHYINKLIFIQGDGAANEEVNSSMQRLDAAWHNRMMPWLAERPHIMSNYLQYRMYNDDFPGKKKISNLANLYLLVAEWFLLKSLLSACAELVENIEEEDIVNIIYSYHAVTKHDTHSDDAFLAEIERSKVNDDLSLIYLLR